METLILSYPTWYLFLCLLAGIVAAVLLYYKDNSFSDQAKWYQILMPFLRGTVVTILSFLLLNPLLKTSVTDVQKPIVVIAQDVSASVASDIPKADIPGYQASMNNLAQALAENYQLETYSFGTSTRPGLDSAWTDQGTNMSDMMQTLFNNYSNRNLGAIIVASDGNYNQGTDPNYLKTNLPVPIYSIALGDTTVQRDLKIQQILYNKIGFLGDKMAVQVDISAHYLAAQSAKLTVRDDHRKIAEVPINISSNDYFVTETIQLELNHVGAQRFKFSLSPLKSEKVTSNNSKTIYIDVIDDRQKILILADSPHPDLTALRQSLATNKNFEVEVAHIKDFTGDVKKYDLVILHQLPSKRHDAAAILQSLYDNQIPRWYIVGAQNDYSKISKIQPLVEIKSNGQKVNEVQGSVVNTFNSFKISEELRAALPTFNPVIAPFGDLAANGNTQVLLNQKIGKIDTDYPLLAVGEYNNIRMAIFCAEGIWRWRLFDYLQFGNHDLFNELVNQTAQYLTVKEDKRHFKVSTPVNIFSEADPIRIYAELYNQNYELINEPDVSLSIFNEEGKEFPYTLNRTTDAYNLNAGNLPPGNYTYEGKTEFNGKQYSDKGQFAIEALQLETSATRANHRTLASLSQLYGGALVYPGQLISLADSIQNNTVVKAVAYERSTTRPIIELSWILGLLLLLLSAEWFMRKYAGGY